MPKRTTNSPSTKAVTTVMVFAALGVGVFAAYVKLNHNAGRVPDAMRRLPVESVHQPAVRRPASERSGPEVTTESPQTVVDLRLPAVKNDDVILGSQTVKVPAGQKPQIYLLNAVLHQLKIEKAQALGIQVKDRNALVDFNSALDKGYGSTEEGYLVKSLQLALGQFPEIDTFQIVIDGKPIDSLGQLDLSEPISVIRPDGKEAKPSTNTDTDAAAPASAN